MPRKLTPDEWHRFLRGRHVCVLATVGPEGEPVLTPIWYVYKDGKLLMRTGTRSLKALNARRDPRVTVCVQDERVPYKSVTVYGRAEVVAEQPGLGAKIARHYLGALGGAVYMRRARDDIEESGEITLAVTPERVITQDYTPETPLIGRLWMQAKRVLPPWL